MAVGVSEQQVRMVELHDAPAVHHQHPVRVHDGVQTMGDREHCARLELPSDRLLDKVVRPAKVLRWLDKAQKSN